MTEIGNFLDRIIHRHRKSVSPEVIHPREIPSLLMLRPGQLYRLHRHGIVDDEKVEVDTELFKIAEEIILGSSFRRDESIPVWKLTPNDSQELDHQYERSEYSMNVLGERIRQSTETLIRVVGNKRGFSFSPVSADDPENSNWVEEVKTS